MKTKVKRKAVLLKFLSELEANIICDNANRHAGGNVSAWLRHAGKKYIPRAGEVIPRFDNEAVKKKPKLKAVAAEEDFY